MLAEVMQTSLDHPVVKYKDEFVDLKRNSQEAKRLIRRKLFEEQDGKCCFCGCSMVLPEIIPDEYLNRKGEGCPKIMATIEHLDSRWYHCRSKKDYGPANQLAVSCYNCNQLRDKIEKGNRHLYKKYGHLFK